MPQGGAHTRHGSRHRHLGAAEEDEVRHTHTTAEGRTEQAGGQRVAELDEVQVVADDEIAGQAKQLRRRPQDRRGARTTR